MTTHENPPMSIREGMWQTDAVIHETDQIYYSWWEDTLSDQQYGWVQFCHRYAESCQYALLRAMAVRGVLCDYWNGIFSDIYEEQNVFYGLSKFFWEDESFADWQFWVGKLALLSDMWICHPPLNPTWLVSYGYTQRQYLTDLTLYWDNIYYDYYKPWEGERFGDEILPIAQVKEIGEATRREIDRIAQHANGRIYVEGVS